MIMAEPSQPQIVASTPKPIVDSDRRMAPDSGVTDLLQSQVILPFSLGYKTYAFLGPLVTPKEAQTIHPFFPCVEDQLILAS